MSPFGCGIKWVDRTDLHSYVREAMANESKERKNLQDAKDEFYERSKGKSNNEKVIIFKEVAKKYGYYEDYFITKVTI